MKKTSWLLFAIIALCLPLTTKAFATKAENSIYVQKDEIIDGNFYAAGSNITIDGTINGDVFCAGQSININGRVEGDIICAGQSVNINGKVGGSIRTAGNSINVNGQVARNLMALGASINQGNSSTVGWDAFVVAASGQINGKIAKDLYGSASNLIISGQIGKNVRLKIDEGTKNKQNNGLFLTKDANIQGDFVYSSNQNATIDKDAKIKGETKKYLPNIIPQKDNRTKDIIISDLFSIFCLLIIGLAIITLTKKSAPEVLKIMREKMGQSFGWGSFFVFLIPLFCIILLLTIIGIPLAIISLLLWIIAIMTAKSLAGIALGQIICEKYWLSKKESLMAAMIIGSIFIWIFCSLPFIGFLISLISVIWGIGGAIIYLKNTQN